MNKRMIMATVAGLAIIPAATASGSSFFDTVFGYKVDGLRGMPTPGTTFTERLAYEYKRFALFEADEMYDFTDANHFAEKSFAAGQGKMPAPEEVKDWSVGDHAAELNTARSELVAALNDGARTKAPELAAYTQVKYDCWMEQQEEGWQYAHIAACKASYENGMAKLKTAMMPKQQIGRVETPAPAPQAKTELRWQPISEAVTVYFDFDDAGIRASSRPVLDALVAEMTGKAKVQLVVTGHADRAGPASYNQRLSERRAQAVRAELVRQGLNVAAIEDLDIEAEGESAPAVITADGVREQRNRRVEVRAYAQKPVVAQTSDNR